MSDLGIVTWIDGAVVEPGSPVITAEDRGLVGDGVFEAIKLVDGNAFALQRHLDRLVVSARPLGIDIDVDAVRVAVAGVLATPAAKHTPSWLRITVTAGPAPMGKGERATTPRVMAAVAAIAPWGPTSTTVTLPWCRNERGALAGLKTLSYIENGIGLRWARDRGADEGLFANTIGNLCEGSGTNVFVVHDGALVTPPLSSGCLAGITRALLLEWLPEAGIDVVEANLPIDVLRTCDEAFVTSTSRDVHPVGSIDGRPLVGLDGDLTRRAVTCFAERAAADMDP